MPNETEHARDILMVLGNGYGLFEVDTVGIYILKSKCLGNILLLFAIGLCLISQSGKKWYPTILRVICL